MTTAVLPLTEDEERALRADWGERRPHHGAGSLRFDVLRLLATLDAERAKRAGSDDLDAAFADLRVMGLRMRAKTRRAAEAFVAELSEEDAAPKPGEDARVLAIHLSRWIVAHSSPMPDHACDRCIPDGDLVKPGFVCAQHVAEGLVAAADEGIAPAPLAQPPSRSDARRIAAQRGEPAPVFDAIMPLEPSPEVTITRETRWREGAGQEQCSAVTYENLARCDTRCIGVAGHDGWHDDGCLRWTDAPPEIPAPPYPASVVEAVRALDHASRTLAHDRECECLDPLAHVDSEGIRSALASLPKELRDAARAPR